MEDVESLLELVQRALLDGREDVAIRIAEKERERVLQTDRYGNHLLGIAVGAGARMLTRRLIGMGADVSASCGDGRNLFQRAIEEIEDPSSRLEMIRLLVEMGANLNAIGGVGMTALHLAASVGDLGGVSLLLDCGADVDSEEEETRDTPLMEAVTNGHERVVELLLAKGADVRKENIYGESVVALAKRSSNEEIRRLFLWT